MRFIGLLFTILFSYAAAAQSNIVQSIEKNVPGQGRVTVHQDESVTRIMNSSHRVSKTPLSKSNTVSTEIDESSKPKNKPSKNNQKMGREGVAPSMSLIIDDMEEETPRKIVKVVGYRVQVYAGNNTRNAKLEALRMASEVRDFYPEVSVYTFFSPPRWLCRVGDYRSVEEAYSMMRKLKATRIFRDIAIVKDRVNVSL